MTDFVDSILILDLETRSFCDLGASGADRYAADPSTEILCMGYRLGALEGVAFFEEDIPEAIVDYLRGDGLVAAWNARFDRMVWDACWGDAFPIAPERWYCIATQMRVNALPAGLEQAGRAVLGTNTQVKDARGGALIRLLSVPQPDGRFLEDESLLRDMGEYCLRDVKMSAHLMNATRLMSEVELRHYHDSEEINDNGVKVDVVLAGLATKYADREVIEIGARLSEITGGEVTKHTQTARLRDWVIPRLPAKARSITASDKAAGGVSLDRSVRETLLDWPEQDGVIPPGVVEVLELTNNGSKSSVAKFKRMLDMAGPDGVVRGAFVFAGASQTGRYSSRGLQLHNFARDCLSPKDTRGLIAALRQGKLPDEPLMPLLSKALRPALVPGHNATLVVGDWSQIEARMLAWLGGAEDRLEGFRQQDADPTAPDLYQRTQRVMGLADHPQGRQIGKVAELALGFCGGVGAMSAMARLYGVVLSDAEKQRLVGLWRELNPWAMTLARSLHVAAVRAVDAPGKKFSAGKVNYLFAPDLVGGTLLCFLPGGGVIQYPRTRLEGDELTAMKAAWTPKTGAKEWPRVTLWHGILAENVTQATCAMLLRETLHARIFADESLVVGHTHDEVIEEASTTVADQVVESLGRVMSSTPAWLKGLPLAAKVAAMTRYGK
jgi:DNA polymerase